MRVPQRLINSQQDRLRIPNDFMIPKTKHSIACLFQELSPFPICFHSSSVLAAIKFDNQTTFQAAEVDDESTNRVLPSELFVAETSIA